MKKQVYIMIGVLIALSIVGMIAFYVQPGKRQERVFSMPVLGSVKIKEINSIILNDTVTLVRNEDIWSFMKQEDQGLVPKPTRQDYVQEFLDVLVGAERGRVIDSDPKDKGAYNLDVNPKKIVLTGEDDVELLTITLGISFSKFPTHVLQIGDDPAVYKTTDALRTYLDKNPQYWLDLRLFPNGFDNDQVNVIRIHKDDTLITLNKNEDTWTYNEDTLQKISTDAVVSYIRDIVSLTAFDFSTAIVNDDVKNGTVVLELANNQSIEVTSYYLANKYFVTTKGGQDDEVFFLQEYGVNRMFPEAEVFFDTSEERGEGAEMEDIDVDETSMEDM